MAEAPGPTKRQIRELCQCSEISDELLESLVRILGGGCAAMDALAEREHRRQRGEDPVIVQTPYNSLVVIPRAWLTAALKESP